VKERAELDVELEEKSPTGGVDQEKKNVKRISEEKDITETTAVGTYQK
jgi:hypothetical protein